MKLNDSFHYKHEDTLKMAQELGKQLQLPIPSFLTLIVLEYILKHH